MCSPILAVSAGLGIVNYIGGQRTARATANAQNAALLNTYSALTDKQVQTNQSAALEESDRLKQGMIERAKIATISGESGALGLSSDRLLDNSFMQEGSDISTLEKNRINDINGVNYKMSQSNLDTQSKINTASNAAPTLIGTGLQIGGEYYKGTTGAKAKAKAASF